MSNIRRLIFKVEPEEINYEKRERREKGQTIGL